MNLVPQFMRDALRGVQVGRQLRAQTHNLGTLASPSPEMLQMLLGGPTKSGATVNENTAFNVSVVRACVGLRAWLLSSLPIKVHQKTAKGSEERRDHGLSRLFRGKVAPGFTRLKWVACSQLCFDIGGNAYSRIYRDTYAEPDRILWQLPGTVMPLNFPRTGAIGWRITGAERDLFEHEVLHIANLSTNGRTGRSPLADLRESVGLAITAQDASARSFSNGNRIPGVIEAQPTTKLDQAQAFAVEWQKHYAGTQNAGKTPILGGGFSWKSAGATNADAELLGSRKFEVEEIARVYQVPLHLVGSTEKATTWGSGIEQLNQGLVDYMLRPLCENWEAEMNTTLLTERELDEEFFIKFNVDALLRGSALMRAQVYEKLRAIRAITVNEIRHREDWPEFPDIGANNPEWPLNNQGGGSPAPAKANATTEEPS